MSDLQARLLDWHSRAFPSAPTAAVALKLGEEAGELQKAVNIDQHSTRQTGSLRNIGEEIGDVAIVLMVLAGRYGFEINALIASRAEEVMLREYGAI